MISLAKENDGKGISKVVRTQVMKDYFWKQRNPENPDRTPADQPTSPSQYKGRFRLNALQNKSKPKPVSKKTRGRDRASNDAAARAQKGRIVMPRGPITDLSVYDPDGFFASTPAALLGGSLDPFDSFALKLKPESLKLIYYYKQSYSRDFLDLNVGGGYCLFDAREHRALFHSILYLVALDFNLRRGFTDDIGCLYHSTEAFRLINEKIRNDIIEDATIAAVALVAAKEALSPFPYASLSTRLEHTSFPNDTVDSSESVPLQGLYSVEQQLNTVVQSLRKISAAKDANAHQNEASRVYDVEYRLHLLQPRVSNDEYASKDMAPLCVALNIYLYLAIRELPAKAQLMRRLIHRLQNSFRVGITKPMTSSNPRKENWMLWTLFIGYGAALENGRQEWFTQALKSTYIAAGYRDPQQLHDTLKNVLWQESWCEHYFDKLREELVQ
ncbi:hypothetical protein CCMA1212_010392 [Trichoderma ghanense]|uniref:Zn2Cys6 transcriptional regulator n=1 Tax=Trichoderma ghanense TaxID=65468 RepID=A0ABY2GQJ1_9HYPO